MKIRCINNTGSFLRMFEYDLSNNSNVIGRFGATESSIYNEIELGKEYLVMGVIIFQTYQGYLIDDNGFISVCPCQLFEVVDDKVNPNWHFRLIGKDEDIYPFVQSIFGYSELCFDKKAYENLIVEMEEDARLTYFRRKTGMVKMGSGQN